ncbi:hypothetical protein J4526_00760 [Desulfurococcaceae archaeon MEX13E-LK6-19]|nr:hypothetical protein J4526_00760 [Desulfurococcaceae archaeon MEX13E-LK6-19]
MFWKIFSGTKLVQPIVVFLLVLAAAIFGVSREWAWYITASLVCLVMFVSLLVLGGLLEFGFKRPFYIVILLLLITLSLSFFWIGITGNPYDPLIILLVGLAVSIIAGNIISIREKKKM